MESDMSNNKDNRLSKTDRRTIVKSRKFAAALTKDGDALAYLATKAYRQTKAGR